MLNAETATSMDIPRLQHLKPVTLERWNLLLAEQNQPDISGLNFS